jgi:hypothetical protein
MRTNNIREFLQANSGIVPRISNDCLLASKVLPVNHSSRPPLWSSGQSFSLQIQRSRVLFPSLPKFLRSRGSGTGSTQPREDN